MPEVVFYQPLRWLANGLGGLADRLAGSQQLLLPYLVAAVGGGWKGERRFCLHVGSRGQCA